MKTRALVRKGSQWYLCDLVPVKSTAAQLVDEAMNHGTGNDWLLHADLPATEAVEMVNSTTVGEIAAYCLEDAAAQYGHQCEEEFFGVTAAAVEREIEQCLRTEWQWGEDAEVANEAQLAVAGPLMAEVASKAARLDWPGTAKAFGALVTIMEPSRKAVG